MVDDEFQGLGSNIAKPPKPLGGKLEGPQSNRSPKVEAHCSRLHLLRSKLRQEAPAFPRIGASCCLGLLAGNYRVVTVRSRGRLRS